MAKMLQLYTNLSTVLPAQVAMTNAQKLSIDKANSISDYNLSTTLPKQSLMLDAQLAQTTAQTAGITASNTGIGISNDIASYNLATNKLYYWMGRVLI
jgi:hypothetical protein